MRHDHHNVINAPFSAKFQSSEHRRTASSTSRRQPKCFTKNALLARENRAKKKQYLTNLENENDTLRRDHKKCVKVIGNQSRLITDLRKEVRYLRSVLANSADISNLVRNIQHNTGMSVVTTTTASCLNDSLLLGNDCVVSKRPVPVAKKTAHSWGDEAICNNGLKSDDVGKMVDTDDTFDPFKFVDISAFGDDLFQFAAEDDSMLSAPQEHHQHQFGGGGGVVHLEEHNYTTASSTTTTSGVDEEQDVGVCLHVSKHRVSLEFCSSCSDNAIRSWTK